MPLNLASRIKQFVCEGREHLFALALSIASLFVVFPQIFQGLIISNCVHAFNFEPWAHHRDLLQPGERSNQILSDSIDGADANLNPSNLQHFSVARMFQVNYMLAQASAKLLGIYAGASWMYLYIFASMMFFTYLYLRKIGVNWGISTSIAFAFTYGSTNMHYYGWAHETQAAVIVLYCLERLVQRSRWLDCCWLMLALLNLGGQPMVHVVVFYSFFITCYALVRLCFLEHRRRVIPKLVSCGLASLVVSLDYIVPTFFHYTHYFESDYRQNYGIRQNIWQTAFTFLFANFYGHPLSEARRWISGSYINTGMFVGSAAGLSACSLGIIRVFANRDVLATFFFLSIVFGFCFVYELPFEHLEQYTGRLPILRMAPPIYFKAVLHLLVAIFGALGMQYLWERRGKFAVVTALVGLVMIFTVYVAGLATYTEIIGLNQGPSDYLKTYMPKAKLGIFSTIATIVCLAVCSISPPLLRFRKWICSLLLICTAIFETKVHTAGWVPLSRRENCEARTDSTDFLKKNVGHSRIIGLGYAAVPSIINLFNYKVEMAAGRMSVTPPYRALLQLADSAAYTTHPTQYLFREITDLNAVVWDLANVKFFLAPKSIDVKSVLTRHAPGSLRVHRLADGTIFERVPSPRHAYAFTEAEVFRDVNEMQDAARKGWSARKKIALEAEDDRLPFVTTGMPFQVEIRNLRKAVNRVSFEISTNSDAYVLLSELFDSRWNAFSGNRQLKTFRAYFFLQGLQVPPGNHVIELKYQEHGLFELNILAGCLGVLAIVFFIACDRTSQKASRHGAWKISAPAQPNRRMPRAP